jgi:hypothetical protein
MYVSIAFTNFVQNTVRNIHQDIVNVHSCSCHKPLILVRFQ